MSVDDLAGRACEEVQTLGRLDEAGVKLLCALMAEETRRFVVLRPPGGWARDEIESLVSEFFIEKGQSLTADLVTIGVTPEVVGKVTRRWIRNFLIDRARRTPLGRIRRKLEEDMLGQYPEFLQVPPGEEGAGRWYLAGQPSYPYGGDFTPLIEAAYAVPGVKAVRLVRSAAPAADVGRIAARHRGRGAHRRRRQPGGCAARARRRAAVPGSRRTRGRHDR